jgi:predicted lactoylglutathione lyase
MSRKIFVNLPVRDLKKSTDFFKGLGFEFNPQFTNEKAACMIVSGEAFVMLLTEPFFQGFTKNALREPKGATEAIVAFSVESRAEVDTLCTKALATGGTPAMDPMDHGFMYVRAFYDPDGHHWEVFWMDPSKAGGN